ncbi:WD40 repeat domain-containing protein [Streptomyces cinerochromogenes]
MRSHDGPVCAMAFSPLGDLLATAGWDMTVRLWKTGSWLRRLP